MVNVWGLRPLLDDNMAERAGHAGANKDGEHLHLVWCAGSGEGVMLKLVTNKSDEDLLRDKIDRSYINWMCRKCGFHRDVQLSKLININECPKCRGKER